MQAQAPPPSLPLPPQTNISHPLVWSTSRLQLTSAWLLLLAGRLLRRVMNLFVRLAAEASSRFLTITFFGS